MMGTKSKMNIKIEENVRITIHYMIDKFVQDEKLSEFDFPATFTTQHRAYIHEYVKNKSLKSKSHGKGNKRFLTIYKCNKSSVIQDDATLELCDYTKEVLTDLLHQLGPDHKLYTGRRTTNASSMQNVNMSQCTIPKPLDTTHDIIQDRLKLPIALFRDIILKCLQLNQTIIISGNTGSGKTTQVPQFILEAASQRNEPCRIICTQPRRISAVSVAERISFERKERLGDTVGYKIRLESRHSAYSNLIFCTNGVLLRYLMSKNSKKFLNNVTHIIVDEVHERDQHSDFLLISLKEKLQIHPYLKVILMSATIESNTFSRYFNGCPVIEIPGRLFPIESFFLEDILYKVNTYNGFVQETKKKLQSSSESFQMPYGQTRYLPTANMDDETILLMNDILEVCWIENDPSDFNHFFFLVEDENNPINFQHTETKMTALMIAAAKGYATVVRRLLNMGADPMIEGKHNFTALDWAVSINGHSDCSQLLTSAMKAPASQLANQYPIPRHFTKALLNSYHSSTDDERVDHRMIIDIIAFIGNSLPEGAILVFLPGYDDIQEQYELLNSKLSFGGNFKIFMLHSMMQTIDQTSVFKPVAKDTRKIILATNIAETSITIDDVVYVIDSGKVKQKHYDSITSTTSLTTTWISQACAMQRAGRAGRTRPGKCFRLYSRLRFESMDQFTLPGILRVPLSEICLQTAIIANGASILEFLNKAIQPPSAMSVKQSIKYLQKVGALDEDENLTDLGIILADMPVDAKLGKMLLYGIVFKCFDPMLTIVSFLSVNDPYMLPAYSVEKERARKLKRELSENTLSDCFGLLRAYQRWLDAKTVSKRRQFCYRYFLNSANMTTVHDLRYKLNSHLHSLGFVKSYGPGNMQDINQFSDNWSLIKACLVCGLYPNICHVDKLSKTIKTKIDKKIFPHPSSVICDKMQKKNKENVLSLPSDWIIFEEKSSSGRTCLIKCNTVISPLTVALFAGPFFLNEEESLIQCKDLDDCSSDIDDSLQNKSKLIIDDWINLTLDTDISKTVFTTRQRLSEIFIKFISNPRTYQTSAVDYQILHTLADCLAKEDQLLNLASCSMQTFNSDTSFTQNSNSLKVATQSKYNPRYRYSAGSKGGVKGKLDSKPK